MGPTATRFAAVAAALGAGMLTTPTGRLLRSHEATPYDPNVVAAADAKRERKNKKRLRDMKRARDAQHLLDTARKVRFEMMERTHAALLNFR